MKDPPLQPTQQWDASLYEESHSFVWKYGQDLLDLLSPRAGERILDIGCGTGHLTSKIARAGAEVIGLDSSFGMIEQARENYPELRFHLADATSFSFDEPFDAVFSNAALHWVKDAAGVAASVGRALKRQGRFVAEFGGKGNVRAIIAALNSAAASLLGQPERDLCPWYFPSIGEYATLLERHGFFVAWASLFDRPTPLEGGDSGMANWIKMFGGSLLEPVPEERRGEVIKAAVDSLRPLAYRDGSWFADYRRIRILAVRG